MRDQIKITKTRIEGVLLLRPIIYKDNRGKFLETFNKLKYEKLLKLSKPFVQDN